MKNPLFALALTALPMSATAHPHVFIDAGISFIFNDQGQLSAIKVSWAYDDFYTMLQLEDMGLDADGDGIITVAEQEKLTGFDTRWDADFEGHIAVTFAERAVKLSRPVQPTAELNDGRLYTSHIRTLKTPIDVAQNTLSLKVYDESYYSAYTLDLGAEILNRAGCEMEQIPADLGKAYDVVEQLLYGDTSNAEDNYPAVGENFADTLTLSCAQSS